jgi:hypothetical protein
MIYNDRAKFVYIGMPKTASSSLDRFFIGVKGSHPVKGIKKHGRIVPTHMQDYDKIVSIRNPYNRVASMYAMAQRHEIKEIPLETFNTFLDYLLGLLELNIDTDTSDYVYRWLPAWKYLEPVKNIKYILRFENLREDVYTLPFLKKRHPKLSNINTHSYLKFDELVTPSIIEKVNIWAKKDFELFGYKKL